MRRGILNAAIFLLLASASGAAFADENGYRNILPTYEFVSNGFIGKIDQLRKDGRQIFPIWPKYPDHISVMIAGNRPLYYDRLIYAYLNIVATTAGVSVNQDNNVNIVFVADDNLSSWVDVEQIIKRDLPIKDDFKLPDRLKNVDIHDCEYNLFANDDQNITGIVWINTKISTNDIDLCVLKSVLFLFGFDPDPGHMAKRSGDINIVDSLVVIRELYRLDADHRRFSSFIAVIFNRSCKFLCGR